MTSKVRIKAGSIEFEYEGETALTMANIKELFAHIEGMLGTVVAQAPEALSPAASGTPPATGGKNGAGAATTGSGGSVLPKLHINSIAEKLGVKSGSELGAAAAARLQLIDGKDTFTRQELLATMKQATKFYKDSMSGNLSKILDTLTGSKFNQIGSDSYSLNNPSCQDMQAKLV